MNEKVRIIRCSKDVIGNEGGDVLGYIAEEQRSFLSIVSRQLFRTHRPFRATIMDQQGAPVLWVSYLFFLYSTTHAEIPHVASASVCLDKLKDVCATSRESRGILPRGKTFA